jgi:mannose-6-phosphate isomerase-like protein (cupin superfamily)
MHAIDVISKFDQFNELWTPKIIGEFNGQQLKIAKVKGEFVWHQHEHEDEMFMVLKGELKIQLRDGVVQIKEGEFYVVPKGVEHNPIADEECWIMMCEPAGTVNTGEVHNEKTLADLEKI